MPYGVWVEHYSSILEYTIKMVLVTNKYFVAPLLAIRGSCVTATATARTILAPCAATRSHSASRAACR
jgi:hypothetical protein